MFNGVVLICFKFGYMIVCKGVFVMVIVVFCSVVKFGPFFPRGGLPPVAHTIIISCVFVMWCSFTRLDLHPSNEI